MPTSVVTGDDAALRALLRRLEEAASGKLGEQLRRAYVVETRAQLARAFDEGRSPSGPRWAVRKAGGGQPLVRTGALRNGFVVTEDAGGIRATNAVPYANAHQHGFRIKRRRHRVSTRGKRRHAATAARVPARPMVPTSRWGPTAARALRDVASRTVRRFFHG